MFCGEFHKFVVAESRDAASHHNSSGPTQQSEVTVDLDKGNSHQTAWQGQANTYKNMIPLASGINREGLDEDCAGREHIQTYCDKQGYNHNRLPKTHNFGRDWGNDDRLNVEFVNVFT